MDLSPPPRRFTPPTFAQVGRPPPGGGDVWSKPLILLIACGIFASFLSLMWELQRTERLTVVEVSFMEEEAAAAERALEQAPAAPVDATEPDADPPDAAEPDAAAP